MIRAVVKHSYVKGPKGIAKGKAHINYIQYRSGEDREERYREFFSDERDDVRGREIKERLGEQEHYGVQMHKLILSPGVEGVDLKAYTREAMELIEREKALELEWYAVEHHNTEHDHVHVVVMGADKEGHRVRFYKGDYKQLRKIGDRYLEREHELERYLDRELERLLTDREYQRDRGDREFERLIEGDPDERKKREAIDAERDRREWEILDRELHKTFSRERGLEAPKGYRQWNVEQAGRLSDFHEEQTTRQARDYWTELAERDPDKAELADRELAYIEQLEREGQMDRHLELDLDTLLTGRDEWERWMDRLLEPEYKEMERLREQELERGHERTEREEQGGSDLFKEIMFGRGQERDDSWHTFETERQMREHEDHRDEHDRDDRDRGDDMFDR